MPGPSHSPFNILASTTGLVGHGGTGFPSMGQVRKKPFNHDQCQIGSARVAAHRSGAGFLPSTVGGNMHNNYDFFGAKKTAHLRLPDAIGT